jgi:hypothetical protein
VVINNDMLALVFSDARRHFKNGCLFCLKQEERVNETLVQLFSRCEKEETARMRERRGGGGGGYHLLVLIFDNMKNKKYKKK